MRRQRTQREPSQTSLPHLPSLALHPLPLTPLLLRTPLIRALAHSQEGSPGGGLSDSCRPGRKPQCPSASQPKRLLLPLLQPLMGQLPPYTHCWSHHHREGSRRLRLGLQRGCLSELGRMQGMVAGCLVPHLLQQQQLQGQVQQERWMVVTEATRTWGRMQALMPLLLSISRVVVMLPQRLHCSLPLLLLLPPVQLLTQSCATLSQRMMVLLTLLKPLHLVPLLLLLPLPASAAAALSATGTAESTQTLLNHPSGPEGRQAGRQACGGGRGSGTAHQTPFCVTRETSTHRQCSNKQTSIAYQTFYCCRYTLNKWNMGGTSGVEGSRELKRRSTPSLRRPSSR